MDGPRLKRRTWLAGGAALLAGLLTAPAASAALSAETMFDPGTVVVVDLQLPPASVQALEADPGEYVEGTFALRETDGTPGGVVAEPVAPGPLTVGVRLKGSIGSFRDLGGKAAFKVKFNEFVKGQKFLGLKKLTLNNMVQDPSMVREALAYEAFRAAGVPAPHTGYAYVRLNGTDYGLHLNLETIDDVALEKRFGEFDDPQHLYEGGPFVDLTAADVGSFEVDEGDESELGDLEALAAAADASAPDFLARLAPVADLGQMVRFWAAERYLGHWDGYSGPNVNNYYLLSDAEGVFRMLPWGTDQTLRNWWHPFTGRGGTLFEQCLAAAECRAAYEQDLTAVAASTAALGLAPRAEALAAALAPWQALEIAESARAPYPAATIAVEVGKTLEFLERRPGLLADWLDGGEPPAEPQDPDDRDPASPGAADPAPPVSSSASPAPPALSTRLGLDRALLGRGLLLARPRVAAAGTVSMLARTGPASRPAAACTAKPQRVAAGEARLSCRLTPAVRRRLATERVTLRLELRHRPDGDGAPTVVARAVRLPRQALR